MSNSIIGLGLLFCENLGIYIRRGIQWKVHRRDQSIKNGEKKQPVRKDYRKIGLNLSGEEMGRGRELMFAEHL